MKEEHTDAQLFTRNFDDKMDKPFDPRGSCLDKENNLTPEQIKRVREELDAKASELRPPGIGHEVKESEPDINPEDSIMTEPDLELTPPPSVDQPEPEDCLLDPEPEPVGRLKKVCGNCSKKYKKSSKCKNCKKRYCRDNCFAPCRYCKTKSERCLNCMPKYACDSCKKKKKMAQKFVDDEAKASESEKDVGENIWKDDPSEDKKYYEDLEDDLGSLDEFVVSDTEFPEVDLSDIHTKRRLDFENDTIHNQKGEKKIKTGKHKSETLHPKHNSTVLTTEVIFDILTDPQEYWKNYEFFFKSVERSVKDTGNEFDANKFRLSLQYALVLLLRICIPDYRNDLCKYIDVNQLDPKKFKEIISEVDRHYLHFVDALAGQNKNGALVQLLDHINKYSEYSRKDTKIRGNGKYHCAVTGNTLKKGEKVYILELRSMHNRNLPKVHFYISRYHDKNLPEFYFSIFDIIFINRWYINRMAYRLKHLIDKKNKFPVSMSGQEKIRIILSRTHLENLGPILTEQLCFQTLLKTISNFDNMI